MLYKSIDALDNCMELFKMLVAEKNLFECVERRSFIPALLASALEVHVPLFDMLKSGADQGMLKASVPTLLDAIISYLLSAETEHNFRDCLANMESLCGGPESLWLTNSLYILVGNPDTVKFYEEHKTSGLREEFL